MERLCDWKPITVKELRKLAEETDKTFYGCDCDHIFIPISREDFLKGLSHFEEGYEVSWARHPDHLGSVVLDCTL